MSAVGFIVVDINGFFFSRQTFVNRNLSFIHFSYLLVCFFQVENLQFLAEEQSLLVMWSPPIFSYSSGLSRTPPSNGHHNNKISNIQFRGGSRDHRTDISHYIVAWGKMHPGPDSVELPKNQTSYSIQKLGMLYCSFVFLCVCVYKHEQIKFLTILN